ncbi:hypothetical protein BFJ63_vAg14392 [Fusarium oxysporum f. sp. narcissi]|uniref:Uncharacterized protein n=1 Tax=Fusarium oxysporum f. sp. narcissi TaxID=451672 RepID=A0A4V1RYT5_FUSOX|nr:hypothetical protein BFJ63_vAg14392 [Fusarium oxysporum f. sp. narcissi]
MSSKDSEAILRQPDEIKAYIDFLVASNADDELSRPQEFADLQNEFNAILSTYGSKPLNIAVLHKILQQAEGQRVATACAKRLEKMYEKLFVKLCRRFGTSRSQQLLNESKGLNQLAEDTTPSNNDSQLTPEQIADDLDYTRESFVSHGGKASRNGPVYNHPTAEAESFQPAQLTSSQTDEVGNADRLGDGPRKTRVGLCTKGNRDKTGRLIKRRCMREPQDKQKGPDEHCSADLSEATVPCTDDDSEASTEF